jgi:uncharacterized membrane protein (DUF4010 family)
LDLTLARDFAIALFIGALVGIDREKRKTSEDPGAIGGIRTFILIAEAGAVSAWLSVRTGNAWIFVASALAVGGVVTAGYLAHARRHPDALGLTTETAALAVYLLGGATLFGFPGIAVGLAITTSALLAFKQPIHGLVGKLETDDLYAGLELLIATFIALPLLPDRPLDPWGALNPYRLWLLVILISSLSLAGYVAVRALGPGRGTWLTAVAGGVVSSTAVTLALARLSRLRTSASVASLLAGGVVLAWLVMFPRILVTVAVVNRALLPALLVPLATMAAAAALPAAWLLYRGMSEVKGPAAAVALRNPFSLRSAIQFGLIFAAVLLVVALVQTYAPGRGLYAVAAFAGIADVDAITLSMAGCVGDGTCTRQAGVVSIVIATLSNTLVKSGMVVTLGTPALRGPVLAATALIVAAGLAVLSFV